MSPLRCEISFDKKIQGPGHVLSHVEKHEMARPQLGSANFKILFLFLVFCIILFFCGEELGSVKAVTKYSANCSNY